MRMGLIGVGRLGSFHAMSLARQAEIDEVFVADVDRARAQEVSEDLGLTSVDVVDELFDVGLDGIVIATPTVSHAEFLCRAVECGIPVFCEKPIAADLGVTLAVSEEVRSRGVPIQIGFQRRFDSGYLAVRELVVSGRLGWIHTIRAGTFDPVPPTASYLAASGGIFRDCCVHDLDAIRWLSDVEIEEVYATGSNRGQPFFKEAGDVDTGAVILRLEDGVIALVSATRYNGAGHDVRLEVFGSRESVVAGFDSRLPLRSVENIAAWKNGRPYQNFLDRFHDAYVRELEVFVEVVTGKAESPCTVEDALAAAYATEACELSFQEHRPVSLDEVRSRA